MSEQLPDAGKTITPTPRTDAAIAKHRLIGEPFELEGRFAHFARQLERENDIMRESLTSIAKADPRAPAWSVAFKALDAVKEAK